MNGYVVNSSSIFLSWESPAREELNGIIREYLVNITEVETGTAYQLSTFETTIIISSLHPYYNYQCSVSAVTIGPGPFSLFLTFQTLQAGMYVYFLFVLYRYISGNLILCIIILCIHPHICLSFLAV